MLQLNTKSSQLLALTLLAFIWGSAFILMKHSLESFSAYQVGAFRMFFASLFLAPVYVRKLKLITRKNAFWLFYVGFFGNMLPAMLFTIAQTQISSSLAGMLNALTPFFTLLLGIVIYRNKARWWNILGVLTGLVGALGLIGLGTGNIFSGDIRYAGFAVLGAYFYGATVNVIKYRIPGMRGIDIAALAMFFVGPISGGYLLFSDFSPALATPNWPINLFYAIILAVIGTALALLIFNMLILKASPIFAASATYIVPVFAILWGLADGETIEQGQYLAMGIILLGIYLVNKSDVAPREVKCQA